MHWDVCVQEMLLHVDALGKCSRALDYVIICENAIVGV